MTEKRNFENAEEMGEWYDGHEVSEEDSTPTKVAVEKRYDPTLTIRIPEVHLRRLKELADAAGLPAATFGRQLVIQQLQVRDNPEVAALGTLRAFVDSPELLGIFAELLRCWDSKDARERASRKLERMTTKGADRH